MHFRKQYNFLSNFYPVQVQYDGATYPSVEHAYVAAKTLDQGERIPLLSMTAGQAKRYGRTINIRPDWDEYRLEVMFLLLSLKFSNHELADKLVAIIEPIVEDNHWHDNFWGNCVHCPGDGRNELGQMLTRIRDGIISRRLF